MIETCRLKNVVIFIQTILSFVVSRKIIYIYIYIDIDIDIDIYILYDKMMLFPRLEYILVNFNC